MSKPDLTPGGGATEDNSLPAGARWATEFQVNQLSPETYLNSVAFDVGGDGKHLIFQDRQSREDYVAGLDGRQPRDMTDHSNW